MLSVTAMVKKTIEELIDIEINGINLNDDLEFDLELDGYSIDELVMEVEDYYGIRLDSYDEVKSRIVTVKDFIKLVNRELKG